MSLSTSLVPDSIGLHEDIRTAKAVLQRIAELIVANPIAKGLKADAVERMLRDREALGSTGLGGGIAIPHCASDKVDDFVVGVLTLAAPVDFDGIDGQPVDFFFFIVGPREARNRHIKLLSAFSKMAVQTDTFVGLRAMTDPEDFRAAFLSSMEYDDEAPSRERVLFQIYLQRTDHFQDVLNLLSSVGTASISVIETRNAGTYLFSMPLFAAFWTEDHRQDGRVILAVVDRSITNRLIRQVQEITGDPEEQTGVLITVQNLTYAAGSLDF